MSKGGERRDVLTRRKAARKKLRIERNGVASIHEVSGHSSHRVAARAAACEVLDHDKHEEKSDEADSQNVQPARYASGLLALDADGGVAVSADTLPIWSQPPRLVHR